jgi:hypothetical protein
MSNIKKYVEAMKTLDILIKASKVERDFVGYRSLKELKYNAERGDKFSICNLFQLHDTMQKVHNNVNNLAIDSDVIM